MPPTSGVQPALAKRLLEHPFGVKVTLRCLVTGDLRDAMTSRDSSDHPATGTWTGTVRRGAAPRQGAVHDVLIGELVSRDAITNRHVSKADSNRHALQRHTVVRRSDLVDSNFDAEYSSCILRKLVTGHRRETHPPPQSVGANLRARI